jgi:8-oxo-dGTP pyrophosphatase MutT (NUDIX family)
MPVTARPAATVVLVRPATSSGSRWETYLLRRSAQSPVLADLWVFPGGTVRADDLTPESQKLFSDGSAATAHAALARKPGEPASSPEQSLSYYVAAARELFEEAGVFFRGVPGSSNAAIGNEDLSQLRLDVERGTPLVEAARQLDARFSLEDFVYYAHWITPEALPQRFDTRFFLARVPAEQEATPSPYEMTEDIWIDVATALERAKARELSLHFATLNHLRRLAPFDNIEQLFSFAASKAVVPVMPNTREADGRIVPFLPPEIEGVW